MDWDAYLTLKTMGIAVFVFGGGYTAAKHLGLSRSKAYLINLAAVITGGVFSRVWYIVQHYFGREPYDLPYPPSFFGAWAHSGAVLYGWVIGGALTIILLSRCLKIPTVRYLDCLAPWLLVAQALNRLGCFDAGCCYGKSISRGFILLQRPNLQAVLTELGRHPVQLYEALFDLLLLYVIKMAAKRQGQTTIFYFTGYAAGRFFLEFLRGDNQPTLLFMTVPQVTSVLILSAVLLLRKHILSAPTQLQTGSSAN